MTTLVPNRFLFSFEFPLSYRERLPALDGTLDGWTDAELLPALGSMDGRSEFAPVWACWNLSGLCLACHVTKKRTPLRCDPEVFWKGDNLRVCTDTRPSSDNRRATRHCQQFYFLPTGGPSPQRNTKGAADLLPAVAGVTKLQRAREDAPPAPADLLHVVAVVSATEYVLEAKIPAECLAGFQPEEHRQLGFYYILEDSDFGQQYLTVGDDLLWYADPSTWAVARLDRSEVVVK